MLFLSFARTSPVLLASQISGLPAVLHLLATSSLSERDLAEEEVEPLREIIKTQTKELKARIAEVARLEAERKRTLDERFNARHRHVMLEAYDQQCCEASKIFADYQRRLFQFVNKARDARRLSTCTSIDLTDNFQSPVERKPLYSTVKVGSKFLDDLFLIETSPKRRVSKEGM